MTGFGCPRSWRSMGIQGPWVPFPIYFFTSAVVFFYWFLSRPEATRGTSKKREWRCNDDDVTIHIILVWSIQINIAAKSFELVYISPLCCLSNKRLKDLDLDLSLGFWCLVSGFWILQLDSVWPLLFVLILGSSRIEFTLPAADFLGETAIRTYRWVYIVGSDSSFSPNSFIMVTSVFVNLPLR